jgi:hypothetical protein
MCIFGDGVKPCDLIAKNEIKTIARGINIGEPHFKINKL